MRHLVKIITPGAAVIPSAVALAGPGAVTGSPSWTPLVRRELDSLLI